MAKNKEVFRLNRSERKKIEKRHDQVSDKRIFRRLSALLGLDDGCSQEEVARFLGTTTRTVRRWLKIYHIERLWKFLKKHALSDWHVSFEAMQQAVANVLDHLDRYADELKTLMSERFQLWPDEAWQGCRYGITFSYLLNFSYLELEPNNNARNRCAVTGSQYWFLHP